MNPLSAVLIAAIISAPNLREVQTQAPAGSAHHEADSLARPLLGPPGRTARYIVESAANLRSSMVKKYTLSLGPAERASGKEYQWLLIHATKEDGREFRVWFLTEGFPPTTLDTARRKVSKYLLQEGSARPIEFLNRLSRDPILPSSGAWQYLVPRASD